MRQVPHHLLLGSGRLARHLSRYFTLQGLSFAQWTNSRELSSELFSLLSDSKKPVTHLWILVSDSAIDSVARQILSGAANLGVKLPRLLHASGARVVSGVRSVHPLMTFGRELYSLESYRKFPWVIEDQYDGETLEVILGGLPNPSVFLPAGKRPLYHSLVSASGNFPSLLWAEIFRKFEEDLSLPRELLVPFLFQSLTNVVRSGDDAITGPLVRGDQATIRAHQLALEDSRLGDLYSAFVKFHGKEMR